MKLKKVIVIMLVITNLFLIILAFSLLHQYKVYTDNFNKKIGGIVAIVQEKYPNISENDLIQLLNGEEITNINFFEKYGIDLKTTEFVAGINTIDSVVSGTADIGMMADYAAVNRLGNTLDATDLKIFSQLSGGGTAQSGGLYVDPKYADDLESLDGSAGFMYQEGTVTYYYASKCIEYLGLDESKQNLINTDSSQTRLALIQKGSASAVYANGSEANYIEDAGWVLAATSQEIGIQTGTYFLATDNYITENKEVLAKFLQAIDESTQYINDHLDETAEYLESDLGIKADDFKANWENYSFTPGFSEEATQHLEDIEKWGFEHGSFPKDYNVRDFITTEAVDIAYPDQATAE